MVRHIVIDVPNGESYILIIELNTDNNLSQMEQVPLIF